MKARQIMNARPRYCLAQDNLSSVAKIMREEDIGDVPVVDEHKKLVGIITDRDIVVRCLAAGEKPENTQVSECMTAPALWLHESADVEEVANLMASQKIRRVPITDDQDLLCGVISLADIEHVDGRSLRDQVAKRVATPH